MAPSTMQTLLGLSTLLTAICDLSSAAPQDARSLQPRVLGFDFSKRVARNTPEANRLRRRAKSLTVTIENDEIDYLINMTIGSPPQSFQVQLDTGSSDIWVPSTSSDACQQGPVDQACPAGAFDSSQSSSFKDIAQDAFSISYQDNSGVTGDYFSDVIGIGNIRIKDQTMGLATQASRAEGIMGIGYNADESIASSGQVYPNIINQLKNQGYINTLAYSLWLNDLGSNDGSILFGGIDTAKFKGSLIVLPVQKGPNGTFTDFTVTLSSITLGDPTGKLQYSQDNLALPVILDSGTTATYIPDAMAQDVLSGVGAINNEEYGYIVPCSFANSKDVFTFTFGGPSGASIAVSFGEFVSPVLNEDGSTPMFKNGNGAVCTWNLLSSGDPSQPILLGDSFLRSAYVVYDLSNNQIGMAPTVFNTTETNVVEISSGSGIPSATATATLAAQQQVYTGHPLEQGHTKTGPAGAAATGQSNAPTFNLGVAGATSTGSAKKSAGTALAPPVFDVRLVVSGVAVLASMVFGGGLIMLI